RARAARRRACSMTTCARWPPLRLLSLQADAVGGQRAPLARVLLELERDGGAVGGERERILADLVLGAGEAAGPHVLDPVEGQGGALGLPGELGLGTLAVGEAGAVGVEVELEARARERIGPRRVRAHPRAVELA